MGSFHANLKISKHNFCRLSHSVPNRNRVIRIDSLSRIRNQKLWKIYYIYQVWKDIQPLSSLFYFVNNFR